MADKETDITWALKLLTADPEKEQSVLGQYAGTVSAGCAGLLTACFVNYGSRRPVWSGIQKHLTLPILFAGAVHVYSSYKQDSMAERDAVFRHYMSLHPEDFREPERKKFSEILMPWIPIR